MTRLELLAAGFLAAFACLVIGIALGAELERSRG